MGCPEPGLYEGVDFGDYCRWDAMNASTLCHGMQSMLHLKAAIDGKLDKGDSSAMRFGRAVHCRLLEPERFATAFPTADRCCAQLKPKKKGDEPGQCKNTGRYMSANGWVCRTHATEHDYEPPDFVMPAEAERIERIREHAFGHKEIANLRKFGGSEVSIVFDLHGVRCKARLDKWIPDGGGFVVDVKTTSRPFSEDGWSRTINEFGYHIQAAFYLAAVKSTAGLAADFWWVAVETAEPYDVAAVRLTDFDRQVGAWEVRRLLSSYQDCLASGVWPGVAPELIQHVGLPAWKAKEYGHIEVSEWAN